jgi:hypothetical protein
VIIVQNMASSYSIGLNSKSVEIFYSGLSAESLVVLRQTGHVTLSDWLPVFCHDSIQLV